MTTLLCIVKLFNLLKQVMPMFDKAHQGVHSLVCTVHCEIVDSIPVHVILLNKLKFLAVPKAFVGIMAAAVK